jgi:Uma2 family endonuclease
VKMVICDPIDVKQLIKRRRATGADRFDEVWDGVYVMSPLADNSHQVISGRLITAIQSALDASGAIVFPGCNVSDRSERWRRNFRCPDVAVYLPGNPAEDRGTHWFGGPDFAVEILSPRDRSRKKFDFYASVGVRELFLVSRNPWGLELYRRTSEGWESLLVSNLEQPDLLQSDVLDLRFRLISGHPRPQIEVTSPADGRTWLA